MFVVSLWMIVYGLAYAVPQFSNLVYYSSELKLNSLHLLSGLNILAISVIVSIFSFLTFKNIDKYYYFIYFVIWLHTLVLIAEILLFIFGKVDGIIIILQMIYDLIIPIILSISVYFYKKL